MNTPLTASSGSLVAMVNSRRRELLALMAGAAVGLTLANGSHAASPAAGASPAPSAQPTPAAPARSTKEYVSLNTARAEHAAGRAILIDIREPEEHATGVVAGAKLLPMQQLRARLGEIPTDPQRPVLLICGTQGRSKSVVEALRERGYKHVSFVEGGMSEWVKRGWPTVPPAR